MGNKQTSQKSAKVTWGQRLWGMPEQSFKNCVTLLIAGMAFLGVITAAVRVHSSNQGATAGRDGQAYIIKAVGKGNAGTQRYSLERSFMVDFQSMVTQRNVDLRLAQEAMSRAVALSHLQNAERFARAQEKYRSYSTILSPPYYNEKTGHADVLQFEADYMIIPSLRWTEMHAAKKEQASAWGKKSNNCILIITTLAVGLFLFGLSLTLTGRLKFLFAALGIVIGVISTVAVSVTAFTRIAPFPEKAIKKYVDGKGQLYYAEILAQAGGDAGPAREEILKKTGQAIADFTQALAHKPNYAAAYQALGDAHLLIGQFLLFKPTAKTDRAKAQSEILQSIHFLNQAKVLNPKDRHTPRRLAWSYFLNKEYDQSIAILEQALQQAPEQKLMLGLNLALNLQACGRVNEARAWLENSFQWAKIHPSAADALCFKEMIWTMDRLIESGHLPGLEAMRKQIKEASVALSTGGQLPGKPASAKISQLLFLQLIKDKRGKVVEHKPTPIMPAKTHQVDFRFEFNQVPPGAKMLQKVYWQGREAAWLTRVINWSGPESGQALWSIKAPIEGTLEGLAPGRYTVELYLDSHLLQSGSFEISR